MKSPTWILTLLCLALSTAWASDHIDGEATKDHPLADLSDLYAFATPGTPGSLTVVLNTHPFAVKKNHFHEKVSYRITLRQAAIEAGAISTQARGERVLEFSFDSRAEPHTMTVKVGELSRTVEFDTIDPEVKNGLRLYSGRRSDPFFFDAIWAGKTASSGKLPKRGGWNSMNGLNALSIVVDLDLEAVFGQPVSLLALVAESYNTETGERFDRLGRPEVTNVTMVNHDDDPDLRDSFNTGKPFDFSPEATQTFRERFVQNVNYYDPLDGTIQWTAAEAERYAAVIAEDYLLIDVSKTNSGEGYFAIESALLAGQEHTAAGGRLLTDDIMDSLFTRLITNGKGEAISDGVDAPEYAPTKAFPYVARPRFKLMGWAKVALVRRLTGAPSENYIKHDDEHPRPGFLKKFLRDLMPKTPKHEHTHEHKHD